MDTPNHLSKKERRDLRRQGLLPEHGTPDRKPWRKILLWGGTAVGLGLIIWGLLWVSKPSAKQASNGQLPAISATDHIRGGDANAPAVLIEYGDMQCPACKLYEPILSSLGEQFGTKLAVVFRHFPLTTVHQNALAASEAIEAADKQGSFWAMHDLLYDKQSEWSTLANPTDKFSEYAKSLGLKTDQFTTDLKSSAVKDRVNSDKQAGQTIGLSSTPTFFLNGKELTNIASYQDFQNRVTKAANANSPTNGNQ